MYRFLIKPKWLLFHLVIVLAMVAMVALGFWQLRRLDERRSEPRVAPTVRPGPPTVVPTATTVAAARYATTTAIQAVAIAGTPREV